MRRMTVFFYYYSSLLYLHICCDPKKKKQAPCQRERTGKISAQGNNGGDVSWCHARVIWVIA